MRFTKMHGAGNDYVYVDCFAASPPDDPATLARRISDRRFGVGADGLILIRPSEVADARMQMFNADGSEAEMCGNGIRCVAKYVYDHGICQRDALRIETGAGALDLQLELNAGCVRRVRVDMGQPILDAEQIPTSLPGSPVVQQDLAIGDQTLKVTVVSMGNPHCVIFVERVVFEDLVSADQMKNDMVLSLGPRIERDSRFPARVNVEFVEVISPTVVRQRTWERGSGETWACGTGASAVCVAGVLAGYTERRIMNHLRGGDLELEWDERTGHVFMTGPAEEVFQGDWPDRQ